MILKSLQAIYNIKGIIKKPRAAMKRYVLPAFMLCCKVIGKTTGQMTAERRVAMDSSEAMMENKAPVAKW